MQQLHAHVLPPGAVVQLKSDGPRLTTPANSHMPPVQLCSGHILDVKKASKGSLWGAKLMLAVWFQSRWSCGIQSLLEDTFTAWLRSIG